MARLAVLLLALFACAACGSSSFEEWDTTESLLWSGPERALDQHLFDARVALEAGELELARSALAAALASAPQNLTALFLEQELQLAEPDADAAALASAARAQAARPTRSVTDVLLAARLEPDKEAARLLLEGALVSPMAPDLEAACRYAIAYTLLQLGDTSGAWAELDRSLAKDPGGLRARRLEARLTRGGNDLELSLAMLDYWLDQAELAPEISSDLWYGALLEVAEMNLALGHEGASGDALERMEEGRGEGRFRAPSTRRLALAELIHAALDADAGNPEAALERVERARGMVASSSRAGRLVLIDKALLNELYLGRDLDAIAAWEAVLARFEGAAGVDADELMRAFEARVRLARLRAAQPH